MEKLHPLCRLPEIMVVQTRWNGYNIQNCRENYLVTISVSVAFMANMVLPPADFSAINAIVAIGQRL